MKFRKISIVFCLMWTLIAVTAMAGETGSADEKGKCASGGTKAHVAVFKVPGLSKSMAKNFSKALADEKGILSAKSDRKKDLFMVTFDSTLTDPDKIKKVVTGVETSAELHKVGPAGQPAAGKDPCGGCPHKKKTGGCGRK